MKYWSKLFGIITLVLFFGGSVITVDAQTIQNEQRSEFTAPVMIVNTSFLNVRTGPDPAYPVLITVVGGTQLPVLGIARDRVWYQVSTVAGVGWIDASFAIGRGDFRNVPTVDAPPLTMFEIGTGQTTPDTAAGIVGAAPAGTVANPFGSGRAWGLSVVLPHQTRTRPTINSNSLGEVGVEPNRIYPILSVASGDGIVWYQTTFPGIGTVWVEAQKTQLRPFACDLTAVVMVEPVRPGIGPDGSGSLTGELAIDVGAEAYLIDSQFDQFKVELFDGSTGWIRQESAAVRSSSVFSEYCAGGGRDTTGGTGAVAPPAGNVAPGTSPDRPPGSTQVLQSPLRVIVNTGFLNIRSGPGSQYSIVTNVPGGTVLDVTGFAPDRVWFRVTGNFGTGWLNSELTILRGNGRAIPVIRDFAETATFSRPVANVGDAVVLYAAPSTAAGVVGALSGPVALDVVARTADSGWVQLNTSLGFGWVQAGQVGITGDLSAAPITGG